MISSVQLGWKGQKSTVDQQLNIILFLPTYIHFCEQQNMCAAMERAKATLRGRRRPPLKAHPRSPFGRPRIGISHGICPGNCPQKCQHADSAQPGSPAPTRILVARFSDGLRGLPDYLGEVRWTPSAGSRLSSGDTMDSSLLQRGVFWTLSADSGPRGTLRLSIRVCESSNARLKGFQQVP